MKRQEIKGKRRCDWCASKGTVLGPAYKNNPNTKFGRMLAKVVVVKCNRCDHEWQELNGEIRYGQY